MTKLLTFGILFLTAVRAVELAKLVIPGILPLTFSILELRTAVVDKLLILGISPLTSFKLALRVVLVAKLVISGTLSSMFHYLSIIYIFFNNINFHY